MTEGRSSRRSTKRVVGVVAAVAVSTVMALPSVRGLTTRTSQNAVEAGPSDERPEAAEPGAVEVVHDLEVVMRDGAVLLADMWRPSRSSKALPVILVRTPYGRQYEKAIGLTWAAQGYAVIIQAVRGRDGSEGTWFPWESELEDGYDTIEWIKQQPWCNGRIGMLGGSYLGHVQILAAASAHPALDCIVPLSPGSDGFSDVPFSGGILQPGLLGWLYACRGPVLDLSGEYPESASAASLAVLPLSGADEAYMGFKSEIWQRWIDVETNRDLPTLTVWDRLEEAEHKVPALHIDGIWDHESSATTRNWAKFSEFGGQGQYLILGPWPHNPNVSSRFADMDYGVEAIIDLDDMRRRWYDHWLRGGIESSLTMPRVQVFATGANRWLHLDQWPAADAEPIAWNVAGDDRRSNGTYRAALSAAPPVEPCAWNWTYDPSKTPRLYQDNRFNRTTRLWFDHRDSDALVLTTPPFTEDTLLSGPVELDVWLESSAEDTDLFGLLVEVTAEGEMRALHLPSPIRARFRNGFDRVEPLVPGEKHKIVWSLNNFAHRFQKGSRLGLAVRSDWFPEYARNLGTLESMRTAIAGVEQRNILHSEPDAASVLRLYKVPIQRITERDRVEILEP